MFRKHHTICYPFFAKLKLFRRQQITKISDISRILLEGFSRHTKRTALPKEHIQHMSDSTWPSISFSPHQYAGLQEDVAVKSCSSADSMRSSWKVQWWSKLWSFWARYSVACLRGRRPLAALTHCISSKEQGDIQHCTLSWLQSNARSRTNH